MLLETLAQYSALMVLEHKYGKHQVRKFLKQELDRYLSGRAGDAEGEQPLYLVEDPSFDQTLTNNRYSMIYLSLATTTTFGCTISPQPPILRAHLCPWRCLLDSSFWLILW